MPMVSIRHGHDFDISQLIIIGRRSKIMPDLWIKNVKLFDGCEYQSGIWNVSIENGYFLSVSKEDLDIGDTSKQVINGEGKMLIPGLIDLHVHLTWDGGLDPALTIENSTPDEIMIETFSNALKYLENGITTVRDLGSTNDAAIKVGKAVEQGKLPGPRVFSSGQSIIMTGGHDPFHGIMIDGPWEALKAVRRQAFIGASVIKISATGGVYGRKLGEAVEDVELRPEEIEMIIDEAHRRNIPVTAHAIGEEGIMNCIRAGIDCIEHGHFITRSLACEMVEKNVSYVPTIAVYRHLTSDGEIPVYAREKSRRIVNRHLQAFLWAKEAGVNIGAGSDAGSPKMPHPSLFSEIVALRDAGMNSLEALKAATSNASSILKMGNLLGVIKPHAVADCVLIDGDPIENLQDLKKISCVIKGGCIVYCR